MKTKRMFWSLLIFGLVVLVADLAFFVCFAVSSFSLWGLEAFAVFIVVLNCALALFGGVYVLVRLYFKKEI